MADSQSDGPDRILAFRLLFESHPAHVALLDASGKILAVSRSWNVFGQENGLPLGYSFAGMDYLAICERAAAQGEPDALEVLSGLLGITTGRHKRFTWVYPCHSPTEKRWFRLWAAAEDNDASGVIVAHRYIGTAPPERRSSSLNVSRGFA